MRKLLPVLLLAACAQQPALRTPSGPTVQPPPFVPVRALRQLEAELHARIARLDSGEVAIAFADLETGRRIGINDRTPMHAASTMKVPVLIELFRQAEEGKLRLDDAVPVSNQFKSIADSSTYSVSAGDDSDSTLYKLVGGRSTLREMARLMTVRSSNLATNNLIQIVGPQSIAAMLERWDASGMKALRGVEDGPAFQRGMNNSTTADGLARSLEIIARCKATTQKSCDEMVEILAAQEFNEMLPQGVPAGTRVAHKTGSITRVQHDGGIIYPPGQWPYVLVYLTRGNGNRAELNQLGADLSRIVWNAVTNPSWINRPVANAQASELNALYRQYRNPVISERQFTHEQVQRAMTPYLGARLSREQVGESAHGRALHLYKFGTGPKKVLFWSQMHGNESTASMSLTDLARYLAESNDPRVRNWSDKVTLYMLPMLNPDGAARFQRQNSYGIDVNRDARALATPEGRALKGVHDLIKPHIGFNLHDQNPRTRVGNTSRLAAIAVLAPVKNAEKTDDAQMLRAKRLAATVRNAVEPFVPGHVSKYDDAFNPRAFGDLIQTWGTEAVLIESGGWYDDPEKLHLRAANFAALVTVLDAVSDESYLNTPIEDYNSLLQNGRSMVKLLITGGTIVPVQGPPYRAEITADVETAIGTLGRESMRITEVGDIVGVETQDTIDARGLFLHPPAEANYITIGLNPSFIVRRGAAADSEIAGYIENGRFRPSPGRVRSESISRIPPRQR